MAVDLSPLKKAVQFIVDGREKTPNDLNRLIDQYKIFKRDPIISALKRLQGQETYTAANWVATKLQGDWMAGWERDLRLRYRSRTDNWFATQAHDDALQYLSRVQDIADQAG